MIKWANEMKFERNNWNFWNCGFSVQIYPDVVIVNDKIEMKLNLLRHGIFQFFVSFLHHFFLFVPITFILPHWLSTPALPIFTRISFRLFFCKAVIYFPVAGPIFFFFCTLLCSFPLQFLCCVRLQFDCSDNEKIEVMCGWESEW